MRFCRRPFAEQLCENSCPLALLQSAIGSAAASDLAVKNVLAAVNSTT